MTNLEELQELQSMEEKKDRRLLESFEAEAFKFGKLMIEDNPDNYPEKLRENFWMVFDKELALTNLEKEDITKLMFMFDIAKLDFKMSKAPFELSFEELKNLDMLEMKMFAKIKRSTGGMQRERGLFAQQHQIRQFITNEHEQPKGGFLSKIGSVFSGRRG